MNIYTKNLFFKKRIWGLALGKIKWESCLKMKPPIPIFPINSVSLVGKFTQLYPTFCHPMDYAVHEILQARILECIAVPFSRDFQPRDWTQFSHIAGRFFTSWATKEAYSWHWFLFSSGLFLSLLFSPEDWILFSVIYPLSLTRRTLVTHWKRLRCWEGLGAGGEGDDRGWDGWMASWTR